MFCFAIEHVDADFFRVVASHVVFNAGPAFVLQRSEDAGSSCEHMKDE